MPPYAENDGSRVGGFASVLQPGPPFPTIGIARPRRPPNNTATNTDEGESQTLVITTITAAAAMIPSDNNSIKKGRAKINQNRCCTIHLVLLFLVGSWIICFVLLMTRFDSNGTIQIDTTTSQSIEHVLKRYRSALLNEQLTSKFGVSTLQQQQLRGAVDDKISFKHDTNQHQQRQHQQPHLVSRLPNKVIATA
jgi:hypothetical protein